MVRLEYPYAWAFCAFASLGAWLYGYDGVYFNGVTALDSFIRDFGTTTADGSKAISPALLSLMTSMINVGELVGSISAAPINDRLGRKGGWIIGAAGVCIGTLMQIVTTGHPSLISAGRAVLGLGVGVFCATSPLYIADVAPASIRGPLLMGWQLTLSVSQIVAAVINRGVAHNQTTFAWRFPTGFQLLFPAVVFVVVWFVPESPRWLMSRGKLDQAKHALKRIHTNDKAYEPEDDIEIMQRAADAESEGVAESSWASLLFNPIERRKVLYSAGALIAQQINGIQWFYYFGTVFSKAIGIEDPFLMTIIVFTIQLVVVALALVFSNRIPRRPLMLVATSIMMLSIFVVGCMGIGADGEYVSPLRGKVIISFVVLEIVAANFSWGPLGWCIASEMAVGPNRNKIYAIAVCCFWISIFVTVFTLPYLYYSANLGPKTGFVYTGLCCTSLSYVYFCVGEVTGRSMEDIDGFFRDRIPVKKWKTQPFRSQSSALEMEDEEMEQDKVDKDCIAATQKEVVDARS